MTQPLYREPDKALIFGVCAGLAERFGLAVNLVRVFWVGANLFFFPLFFVYIGLAVMLPKNPHSQTSKRIQNTQAVHEQLDTLQSQLEQLQHRVGRLENYVTSNEFLFQRKLWDLKKQG